MRIGALLGPVLPGASPRFLADQAKQYASTGFQSLWAAHAVGRGFMLPEPLQTLTIAATATEQIEIGTAVLQLPLSSPVELAHRILTLQQLCGDRLILGIGVGSTEADFDALGHHYHDRYKTFRRSEEILRGIFQTGKSDTIDLSPWPEVAGGPKLFLGTWGAGVERAAHNYDGWIASGHYRSTEELAGAMTRYRAAGGSRAIVSTIQVASDCDLGELRDRLQQYANIGFDDAVVMLMPGAPAPDSIVRLVNQ